MKTLLACLLLLTAIPAYGQTDVIPRADDEFTETFTANGNGTCRAVKPGVSLHSINWRVIGALTAGTVKLQGSVSSDCSSPTDIIGPQLATAGTRVVNVFAQYPYIQLVFASYAGSGTINAYYSGLKNAQPVLNQIPAEGTFTFTANGSSPCWVLPDGVAYHSLRFVVLGTVSAGGVTLRGSKSIDCSSLADVIAEQDITSVSLVNGTAGAFRSVRLSMASFSGTGSVHVTYLGEKTAGSSFAGTITSMPADATELPAAAALADNTANPTVPGVGAFLLCFDGSTWDRCTVSSGGDGTVDSDTTRVTLVTNSFQRILSDNTNNDDETEVKASAAVLVGATARNSNASTHAYLKCTNLTAANTTPGSSAVRWGMMIPAGGGFIAVNLNIAFSTALTCYIATGAADSDATDAAQNEVEVGILYR